jgi:hypothetical protein
MPRTGGPLRKTEKMMPNRVKLMHPALKHGAYSALAVLPGEDRAEFEKLHRALIAEYSPSGPLEHHYVAELARLIWRLQNLATLRVAKLAREPFICTEGFTSRYSEISPDLAEVQAAQCAAMVKSRAGGRSARAWGPLRVGRSA